MIRITDNKDCCGCHACASVCARHSITMHEDNEGFLYPVVDASTCTDCGLCERVCPVINQDEPRKPLKVYAAKNRNEEIRRQSSSGGIFTPLAEAVIREGGVIFGAKFDKDWNVVHAWTDTIEGIADFRGSKYVQSTIGDAYREAREFLKQGRKVLFSGTPCQIAGLRKFLRKEYENLLTVEVVCHGVPSPLVWREYLKETSKGQIIQRINFRDKNISWKNYRVLVQGNDNIVYQPFYENIYMKGFLRNIYLRPSCYACPAKSGKSSADITLGDFWGIENYLQKFDDDKGVSACIAHTDKGIALLDILDVEKQDVLYEQVLSGNPCIERSVTCKIKYIRQYWKGNNRIESIYNILKKMKPNFVDKCVARVKHVIRKLILK